MSTKVNPLYWVALVLFIALLVALILSQPSAAQVPGYPEPDPWLTYTFIPEVRK